jgi:hypothetical protein
MEFYPRASEEIPKDLPPKKRPRVRMTVYVDADHAHDLVTRRSITGWVSKRQKIVETSTYGSELVDSRFATELILEVRYMLLSLGFALDGPTLILGNDILIVLNTTVPSNVLNNKNNAIAYHLVREAIAERIMRFEYIKSEENMSDVLTKPLSN